MLLNWCVYLALCLIWGSSFILMKLGLYDAEGQPLLSAYQVAAIRMASAGIALLPFLRKALRPMPSAKDVGYLLLVGLMGSFVPAFLFCLAETRIDSALAGMINAMTPLATLLVAVMLYQQQVAVTKWVGIGVGFMGCLFLFVSQRSSGQLHHYALFALAATLCYGLSVNLVKHKLSHVGPLPIAAISFGMLLPLSIGVLVATGFFSLPLRQEAVSRAFLASATLGAMGTALATVLFYFLVKRAGILFGSMVTYGIPFVALAWGYYLGEAISIFQIASLGVILAGVYLANSSTLERLAKKIPGRRPPGSL